MKEEEMVKSRWPNRQLTQLEVKLRPAQCTIFQSWQLTWGNNNAI